MIIKTEDPRDLNGVKALLDELARARFYGSLQLDFQNGSLILIRKTETIKPKGDTHYARQHEER